MQHIKDHPELHEQSSVFLQSECGTAACFAGWACMLSGFQPAWKSSYIGAEAMGVETDAGRTSAMEIARSLLGLTAGEAGYLFAPFNTRTQLEYMVKDLVNGDELKHPAHYDE